MTAREDVVNALMGADYPHDEALRLVDDLADELGREEQRVFEDDLERARDRSHRLGVQAVVDSLKRLMWQTSGVPSRRALLEHLDRLGRSDGTDG